MEVRGDNKVVHDETRRVRTFPMTGGGEKGERE